MSKILFTNLEEPSEKELGIIMHEVAVEAKRKAAQTKIQLTEKIKLLIKNLKSNNG